jgi:hypothetical protein
MPDQPGLEEMWRSAVAANLRYYEAWTRIASDWLRDLAGAGSVLQTPGAIAVRQVSEPTAAPGPGPRPPSAAAPGPALVLEAHAGEQATGAFLVENQLGRPVETPIVADEITGPGGAAQPASLEFEPTVVSLAPQERCVVRVRTAITEDFAPGSDYRTVIRGPDLPGTSIPLVLRRADPAPAT